MSAPVQTLSFSMPMFRAFVPEKIRPWIYLFMAATFQFSGGTLLGNAQPDDGHYGSYERRLADVPVR